MIDRLKEIDNAIKAIQDMLEIWQTDELKQMLCDMLETRTLELLRYNREGHNNDIFN